MSEASSFTAKPLNKLKEAYGNEIELIADDGAALIYTIKAEYQLGEALYAALQSEEMRADDEIEFLRIIESDEGLQLETIEDDEEWEAASEAYDDLLFANDERP